MYWIFKGKQWKRWQFNKGILYCDELEEKRDNFALEYPMERGIIKDWDIMEKL